MRQVRSQPEFSCQVLGDAVVNIKITIETILVIAVPVLFQQEIWLTVYNE